MKQLETVEALVTKLDAAVKAGSPPKKTPKGGEGDGEDETDEEAFDLSQVLPSKELTALKKQQREAKLELAAIKASFVTELRGAASKLTPAQAQEVVLGFLNADLYARMTRFVAADRRALVEAFHNWGNKYAVTLADLEQQREVSAKRIRGFLEELGYA